MNESPQRCVTYEALQVHVSDLEVELDRLYGMQDDTCELLLAAEDRKELAFLRKEHAALARYIEGLDWDGYCPVCEGGMDPLTGRFRHAEDCPHQVVARIQARHGI